MSNYDQALQAAKVLAATPQGQQLLQQLRRKDSQQLQTLLQQASAGNLQQAKQSLASLLSDPEIQKLLQSLGGSHG